MYTIVDVALRSDSILHVFIHTIITAVGLDAGLKMLGNNTGVVTSLMEQLGNYVLELIVKYHNHSVQSLEIWSDRRSDLE